MSADLFAAFEDLSQPSQPPSQPTGAKPFSSQSTSTPFSFASPQPSQQGSRPLSTSSQVKTPWHTTQPSHWQPTSVAPSALSNSQPVQNDDAEDDDDGWGDFEVAPSQSAPGIRNPPSTELPKAIRNTNQRPTRIVRASTLDLVSNNLVEFPEPSTQPSELRKSPALPVDRSSKSPGPKERKKSVRVDPDVLFDADDFEGYQDGEKSDDDFGEFETVQPPAQPPLDSLSSPPPGSSSAPPSNENTAKKASDLLLDLDTNDPIPEPTRAHQASLTQPHVTIRKQEPNRQKPYVGTAQPQGTHIRSEFQTQTHGSGSFSDLSKPPTKLPIKPAESSWDWDSVEPPKGAESEHPTKGASTSRSDEDAAWDWDPADTNNDTIAEAEDSALPPINIPPPSILLSAFPQLFDQANEYLYKPVSGQTQSIKDRILSDAKVHDFLRGYLSLAVVAARIIAGRKMRWHRDKFLSQSMSISAAGSKGMKLAGVDKIQTAREDREAADVVSNWKSQVGRLRAIVAAANSAGKGGGTQLKIPEIADTMQVQIAKDVPTAPKACVICGLKRNERLAKVDHGVEDSFGEWWSEHWGHVACKRFWLQHEKTLRQR
ncbi:hypothetical protein F5Y14DRAFT_400550 [Nemania sp. NC0429]|nr:hypothetical protein F5Y14DRAFT_400550 [Nemania sp. NC0429]